LIYDNLKQRGLIYQTTADDMGAILAEPLSFYCGFDPTSDSLHIGSLLPLLTAKRLQMAGHRPILLLGGATARIGDPSGKSKERTLLSPEVVAGNVFGIQKVMEKFLDFSGPNGAIVVNNEEWLGRFSYLDFLRDVGKHFPVNIMMAKDSVKSRVENRDQGISYTEFSYMLLQAYDFYHLNKAEGCRLQVGGSDQWGNITAGIDLIRRMQGEEEKKETVYGLTFPLVTKSDGTKFGKTESGNIWLDPSKTSPYQFYQFLVRQSDADVAQLLKFFSFKPWMEVKELLDSIESNPGARKAQKALAEELTIMVHGDDECQRVRVASEVLFSGELELLDRRTLLEVFSEAPSVSIPESEKSKMHLVDVLVKSELCTSKGNARKDIKAGAISVNGQKWKGEDEPAENLKPLHGNLLVLRRGKKSYCLVIWEK